jgi:hypothetical protein
MVLYNKELIMRTIANTEKITLKVTEDELIGGKWLNYTLLSKKLQEIEVKENMKYKSLRNKLYNSINCNKYNMGLVAGLPCIDIDNPMKSRATASLELAFKRV